MKKLLAEIVSAAFEELVKEGDPREIGKFLAYPTERIIAPAWLEEVCGLRTTVPEDEEGQQPTYDRLGVEKKLRVQVKFRGGKNLHMEQTRRTTGKNASNGAKNGQVRYSIDSFDFILFIIPKSFVDVTDWEYLAIPSFELEDPQMPGYCTASVRAAVRNKYQGLAKETIQAMMSQMPPSQ